MYAGIAAEKVWLIKMNDFTKDELEYLEEAVKFHIEEDYQQNPALSVLDKLQSMIDNYCEHEFIVFNKEYNHVECIKCGRIR